MILHVSPFRSLAALVGGLDHKTASIRAKASCMIAVLLRQHPADVLSSGKELEALKSRLSKLLQDPSPETRSNCREIVRTLLHVVRVNRADLEGFVKADLVEKALREPSMALKGSDSPLPIEGSNTPSRPTSHLPRISKYRNAPNSANMQSPNRNAAVLRVAMEDDNSRSGSPSLSLFDDPSPAGEEEIDLMKLVSSPGRASKERVVHSATPSRSGLPMASPSKPINRLELLISFMLIKSCNPPLVMTDL